HRCKTPARGPLIRTARTILRQSRVSRATGVWSASHVSRMRPDLRPRSGLAATPRAPHRTARTGPARAAQRPDGPAHDPFQRKVSTALQPQLTARKDHRGTAADGRQPAAFRGPDLDNSAPTTGHMAAKRACRPGQTAPTDASSP